MKKDAIIVGAGLVGSLLSIYLSRRGYKTKIFERRPDMRKAEIEPGRSINLALSDRGLLALDRVGLSEEIKKISIPMHGRFIHNLDGSTAFQPYGKEGQFINSVSRGELNKKLMDLAEKNGVEIHFSRKCISVDWEKKQVTFEKLDHDSTGGPKSNQESFLSPLLFGADGAFSATRLQYQLQHDRFEYSQHYIDCGYKELRIPAGNDDGFLIEKNALHIWPRKDYMLIALPNMDGSFTCTLFFPFEGELSFKNLGSEDEVNLFFENTFPDILEWIPDLTQQFFQNPVASLVTVKCFPWTMDDQFALIGDAAHAIVPFFGQGMNCGFEDCRILDELIEKCNDDWMEIFRQYQSLRKPDGDAIADLALDNFVEMRDKTADPKFLLQKKIEAALHEKYPDQWIPAYAQVTFSPDIRYSDALKRGRKQEAIMMDVMQIPELEKKWQDGLIEKLVLDKLNK